MLCVIPALTLTAGQVATETRRGTYADGGNLYLRIGPTGAKSWVFRYQHSGRRRDMGLGPVSLYPLAEMRDKVIDLRRGLRDGIDFRQPNRGEHLEDGGSVDVANRCLPMTGLT